MAIALYFTRQEAADHLHISTRTLDRWVTDGVIPAYRVRGIQSLRFKQTDIEAMLVPIDPRESAGGT